MNRDRKADLQRKMAMAPVATPPVDLADRIKAQIPSQIAPVAARPRTSLTFAMRIAASLVLVLSSLYLASRLTDRTKTAPVLMDTHPAQQIAQRTSVPLPELPPAPGSAKPQTRADLPPMPVAPPRASIAAIPPHERVADAKHEEAAGIANGEPSYASNVIAEATPAAPAAASAPAPAPALAPVAPQVADAMTTQAKKTAASEAITVVPRSAAATRATAPLLSADATPASDFATFAAAVSRGETPPAVDAASLVQHFAAPASAPSRVHVELEASAAPLDTTKWLLRVSVDAPAGVDPLITLTFGNAIARYRPQTNVVMPNVTSLYELEFTPLAKREDIIATVTADGATSTVRLGSLHSWASASSRTKRATLAAAWARTLQSHGRSDAIIAKAREQHLDDLADLAQRVDANR